MTDTRPTVPPVEGHYAIVRGQSDQPPTLCGPICLDDHNPCSGGWTPECSFDMSGKGYEPQDDLIGLLDRSLVKALIDGRVQALMDAAIVATATFVRYGDLHAAKPDKVKADANYHQAMLLQDAITAIQGTPHD